MQGREANSGWPGCIRIRWGDKEFEIPLMAQIIVGATVIILLAAFIFHEQSRRAIICIATTGQVCLEPMAPPPPPKEGLGQTIEDLNQAIKTVDDALGRK